MKNQNEPLKNQNEPKKNDWDEILDEVYKEFVRIGKKLDSPKTDWTNPYVLK